MSIYRSMHMLSRRNHCEAVGIGTCCRSVRKNPLGHPSSSRIIIRPSSVDVVICGIMRRLSFITGLFLVSISLYAGDSDRDFSGKWLLDTAASNTRALDVVETSLAVSQGDAGILCSTGTTKWSYVLDGSETRKRIGDESRNSVTKWEGSALLINTLVS